MGPQVSEQVIKSRESRPRDLMTTDTHRFSIGCDKVPV